MHKLYRNSIISLLLVLVGCSAWAEGNSQNNQAAWTQYVQQQTTSALKIFADIPSESSAANAQANNKAFLGNGLATSASSSSANASGTSGKANGFNFKSKQANSDV